MRCITRADFVLVAALGLAGCAGPQVRTLGNGGGPPAFELRGSSLAAIEGEASRRCSRGYEVLRLAERYARAEPHDNAATQWLQRAGDWLSGQPGNEAQATIVCRA